jgi:hypothetical protein
LMPLESIFGWIKHQILGGRLFETVADLQAAVVRAFRERVDSAKARRDYAWATGQVDASENSRSVL